MRSFQTFLNSFVDCVGIRRRKKLSSWETDSLRLVQPDAQLIKLIKKLKKIYLGPIIVNDA